MATPQTEFDQRSEPTIRELVGTAAQDVTAMISGQVELAKAELRESAKQAGSAFGLLAAAGVLGIISFAFLLVTLTYVLVELGLPMWAASGIVTLFLLIVTGTLAAVGKAHADRVRGPEQTIKQLEETKAAFASLADAQQAARPSIER